jgi:hypothetical protein
VVGCSAFGLRPNLVQGPRPVIPRKNHPHGKQVNGVKFYFKPKISSLKYNATTGTYHRFARILIQNPILTPQQSSK